MPIHDWARVDAGVFHGFHLRWIAEICKAMNNGLLPSGYYVDAEQVAERKEVDVLTLQMPTPVGSPAEPSDGGVAVVEAGIGHRVAGKVKKPKPRQRRLVLRHVTGHRVVALLELVSPGNKGRRTSAIEFAGKAYDAIEHGIHVTMIDLFPATRAAPHGLHNIIWRRYDRERVMPPLDRPLTLAAFTGSTPPEMFFEFRRVGEELPAFPVMLSATRGVFVPLAETYAAAFAGSPPYLRDLLTQPATT
ncbi:DUF4058 family protein [Limnoglobus roseus]|uniref:DUF4058 domain-containing protein n=1 Tax=Limnoglobus roseus TaxID=2598579 RepID=A0A5C1AGM9_9BACT|nr:DUF4058 family protein [Limnoglobus roseus]QEL17307.1 hypothetical protein PX52LOC_04290 [Limnoglobus roseus]